MPTFDIKGSIQEMPRWFGMFTFISIAVLSVNECKYAIIDGLIYLARAMGQ